MNPRTLSIAAAAIATGAQAQTFNSFRLADALNGITVEELSPTSYRVSLTDAPTMVFGGTSYPILDVFGFWALSEDDDLIGSTSAFSVWTANANNASTGGILGWRTNPNTGLEPEASQVFAFDSLDPARVEYYGYHVRLDGTFPGTSGNTGFVYAPAPGPAVIVGAAAGALLIRRRRVNRR